MLSSVKAEIDRELKADELKEILDKQAQSNPLETILEDPADKPVTGASKTAPKTVQNSADEKSESQSS